MPGTERECFVVPLFLFIVGTLALQDLEDRLVDDGATMLFVSCWTIMWAFWYVTICARVIQQ